MSEFKKFLIVGLGNVGPAYEATRHNVGFMVIDELARNHKINFTPQRFGTLALLSHKGKIFLLLKPDTYMNMSGNAVSFWLKQEKIPLENLLVITDDMNLPFGHVRLRASGSSGGQNGLNHINQVLQTEHYARLRVGIGGNFPKGKQVEYVLGKFTNEETEKLPLILQHCSQAVISFGLQGISITMNHFNKQVV